jgi:hypothetical protein
MVAVKRISIRRRVAWPVLTMAVACAAMLAVAATASGRPDRALAASLDVAQTCSTRVDPGTHIDVQATVHNTGTEDFVPPIDIVGDAGTDGNTADDFALAYSSGNTGDANLNPGETWTFVGGYTAPADDVTNIVTADANTVTGGSADDLAACETDVAAPPKVGVRAGVEEISGTVLVKKKGKTGFVPLNGETELPIGSQVDTTKGVVELTQGLGGGNNAITSLQKTAKAQFYDGVFTILQAKKKNAVMTLKLEKGNFRACRGAGAAKSVGSVSKSKKPVRRLWGSGKGRFSTRGRYSSATVRGTKWLTVDQCNGTLVRVVRGIVRVRDFRLRKNIDVRPGHSYLARAPG